MSNSNTRKKDCRKQGGGGCVVLNGLMGGWVGGWMGGWVDGWMGWWVDGWIGWWVDGLVGKGVWC